MTESIRRQLVVPPYVSAIHMAAGLGMVAVGIVLVAASSRTPDQVAPRAELAEITSPAPVEAPRVALTASEQAAPIPDEIKLVFRAGGASYLRLDAIERDEAGALRWPRHGAVRLVEEDGVNIALAAVGEADVPAVHRAWAGRQVVVDGTCRATVTDFAVVSRLYGEPVYAGVEKDRWDAASVMQLGSQALAARLDGCSGTFARDAELAPAVVPEPVRDAKLARVARSALIASSAGAEMTQRWDELADAGYEGAWWEHPGLELKTWVVRHPRTGATLVAVHAHAEFVCGGPDINLWGLYRAAADGTLAPVRETRLDRLHSIEQIVDVEGDGELELIGRSWLGNAVILAGEDGRELDRDEAEFYGCPC